MGPEALFSERGPALGEANLQDVVYALGALVETGTWFVPRKALRWLERRHASHLPELLFILGLAVTCSAEAFDEGDLAEDLAHMRSCVRHLDTVVATFRHLTPSQRVRTFRRLRREASHERLLADRAQAQEESVSHNPGDEQSW
jgi:hypothetical protein